MISALAVSPVAEIATLPAPADQSAAVARLGLADVSLTARHGCKGPGTVAWLQDLGLPIPPEPNSFSTAPMLTRSTGALASLSTAASNGLPASSKAA